jgi:hypothetical protein
MRPYQCIHQWEDRVMTEPEGAAEGAAEGARKSPKRIVFQRLTDEEQALATSAKTMAPWFEALFEWKGLKVNTQPTLSDAMRHRLNEAGLRMRTTKVSDGVLLALVPVEPKE